MATLLRHSDIESHDVDGYEVNIGERRGAPGAWNVEAIDEEGSIEQAIFLGPKAEERAHDYAAHRYHVR